MFRSQYVQIPENIRQILPARLLDETIRKMNGNLNLL